ncbi:acyl-CoA acyltransferase [Deinococcus sp.]|uniref:acyl-CoA acyltransferase n=1 Tax=Deinococcus sp. TaxID=47478 RepID=UPI0025B9CEBA|nr:acyl-CoA acyltransferase [Deinococcus sp.]
MNRTFVIREVSDPWKMLELEQVQRAAWNYTDRELTPATLLRISATTGGIVLAAYPANSDADTAPAVGLAYGFPALHGGKWWHHSHLLAVDPEWRGSEMAVALKLAQRERVLAQGLTQMTWTFDPLIARNARLNLGKLGASAVSYHADWYPTGTRRGEALPADRLMIQWDLTRPSHAKPAPQPEGESALATTEHGLPAEPRLDVEAERVLIEVPTYPLEPGPQWAWRLALRTALGHYLNTSPLGYAVTDLARSGEQAFYVLTRQQEKGHPERVTFKL